MYTVFIPTNDSLEGILNLQKCLQRFKNKALEKPLRTHILPIGIKF